MANYVKIYYGPNESFFTYVHRPQKLNGLRDTLKRLGYRVDLVPKNIINYCMIEMCGRNIFQCNINNLMFNRSSSVDSTRNRAVCAVLEATNELQRADDRLWTRTVLEDQVFKHILCGKEKYGPQQCQVKPLEDALSVMSHDDCCKCCTKFNGANKQDADHLHQQHLECDNDQNSQTNYLSIE